MTTSSCTTLTLAAALLTAAAAAPAQVVVRGNSALRGTVTDTLGRPLPGALVIRDGSADTARADSTGRFAIERLALGRHVFVVKHRGYEQVELQVTFRHDTTYVVDIPLEPAVPGGAVTIAKLDSVGFSQRRREAEAVGLAATFLGPAEIAARRFARVTQLLDGVPEITVRLERGAMTVVVAADRQCLMNVWVDGERRENVFQAPSAGGRGRGAPGAAPRATGLDGLVRPERLAAIEVYPAAGRTPPQFLSSGSAAQCGALVIWTR